jgi:hypothetical protein
VNACIAANACNISNACIIAKLCTAANACIVVEERRFSAA